MTNFNRLMLAEEFPEIESIAASERRFGTGDLFEHIKEAEGFSKPGVRDITVRKHRRNRARSLAAPTKVR